MRTFTKLRLVAAVAVLGAPVAAAAGSLPVPSFNDLPELYSSSRPLSGPWQAGGVVTPHPNPSFRQEALDLHPEVAGAAAGATGPLARMHARMKSAAAARTEPSFPYGPWIVTPSSGG
jgi:hypothetical protein